MSNPATTAAPSTLRLNLRDLARHFAELVASDAPRPFVLDVDAGRIVPETTVPLHELRDHDRLAHAQPRPRFVRLPHDREAMRRMVRVMRETAPTAVRARVDRLAGELLVIHWLEALALPYAVELVDGAAPLYRSEAAGGWTDCRDAIAGRVTVDVLCESVLAR